LCVASAIDVFVPSIDLLVKAHDRNKEFVGRISSHPLDENRMSAVEGVLKNAEVIRVQNVHELRPVRFGFVLLRLSKFST
jgi:hypothetical protein